MRKSILCLTVIASLMLSLPGLALAEEEIESRLDYTFDPLTFFGLAAVIVFFFGYAYFTSQREYKEMIDEHFGNKR